MDNVLLVIRSLVKKLRSIRNKPDDGIEISFDVKLSTIAGVVIASASAEVNFDVVVH